MKLSELIAVAQKALEVNGDMDVVLEYEAPEEGEEMESDVRSMMWRRNDFILSSVG